MRWLDRLTWPLAALSDMQRDMALILTSQVEILTRLKELKAERARAAARDDDPRPPAA